MKKSLNNTKMLVLIALFIALSVIGAGIKVPGPISSIALDALPAFLAALVLGGIPGAVVGAVGHMVSALLGGFPLSLPIHIIIAVQMAAVMLAVGWLQRKHNTVLAVIAGIFLNGVAAPATFILIPKMGVPFFMGAVLPLLIAGAVNAITAGVIYYCIRDTQAVKVIKGA